jgi:hypothetical protein
MPRNLIIALALVIVVAGTAVGTQGHFWIGIAADVVGILVAVSTKVLTKRRPRAK